ncbi:MAG: hypothetical protein JNK23_03035 [Opitutaceae bacterium]|nr:hypothetical protein [Opitutaceae bacterium]
MPRFPFARAQCAALVVCLLAGGLGAAEPRWFKGNLHTHSLWSDGDDYPEMIADWFKREGYHFLAISDHNVLQQGQRWLELKLPVAIGGVPNDRGGGMVLEKYLRRFGPDWVEVREANGKRSVRLKPLDEYRSLLEEPGRFLMIPGLEITSNWKRPKTDTLPERTGPVHMNLTNPRENVAAIAGEDATVIMQQTVDAVNEQRKRTGQPMLLHLNHPNFRSGITAEELMRVKGERFFEVYNGHPGVDNEGDAARLSMDAMWDAILTVRLAELGLEPMFGVGTDDSHHYHTIGLGKSNVGRGWVMVRARHLTAESIVLAMEAGDFYASSGVTLDDVKREGRTLSLAIKAEPGVTYRTQFIGTRRGYDPKTELLAPIGKGPARTLPHRRYSKDVGAVLAEADGARVSYTLQGDELYVRAKIVSSKPKVNGSVAGEFETAWTQPLVNEAKR